MCGIAGFVNWNGPTPSTDDLRAMCDAILHRGPDDEGIHADAHAAIGMRRLSIIDVATGHQPIANEDRTVWVVFNGEIYNYVELRRDLIGRGHVFSSQTDTETLVHLYEEYGPDLTSHLRGMFAFAIWDTKKRQLLLARDRLGIKPLYYAALPGGVAFASELKALLQLPAVDRRLNWGSVGHLLTFLTTPATQSILAGVQKLDAAHRVCCRPGRPIVPERYWDVRFEPNETASERDLSSELEWLLDEAVALHLRSDVPVGAFLSGGIDSSVVVAAMARQATTPVKTFSVGFADRAFDERSHARRVAAACGTEHHDIVLAPESLDLIEELVWHLDEPFGDSSAIPTYLVSRLASRHVKVVLSGDGGDELFGGYDKYLVEQREQRYDRLSPTVKKVFGRIGDVIPHGVPGHRWFNHMALDGPRRYLDACTLFARREQRRLLTPEAAALVNRDDPFASAIATIERTQPRSLAGLQYHDLRAYLPLDILVKVDRMTMAHSIEARPVLLDHRLVEFAATIPERWQINRGVGKYLLKETMRAKLPEGIVDRPKQGFAVPLAQWFRGPWTGLVRDVLLSKPCRERGIIDPRYVEHLLSLNARGRSMDRELWTLVSFEQWCRMFLDRRPAVTAVPRWAAQAV